MPRLFFTVVFLLFTASYSLAQAAAADSVEVLTLDRAIAESLQNNRLIKISDQSVLYANDEILAARTQRYQIGGLGVATFITLLLVPVLYSIFVFDLKIVTWGKLEEHESVGLPLQPKGELS
jgi:hypothetical protein